MVKQRPMKNKHPFETDLMLRNIVVTLTLYHNDVFTLRV